MQLLRPYCDKLEETKLYDVHNLNNVFGLSQEISQDLLQETKALNTSIKQAIYNMQEESLQNEYSMN